MRWDTGRGAGQAVHSLVIWRQQAEQFMRQAEYDGNFTPILNPSQSSYHRKTFVLYCYTVDQQYSTGYDISVPAGQSECTSDDSSVKRHHDVSTRRYFPDAAGSHEGGSDHLCSTPSSQMGRTNHHRYCESTNGNNASWCPANLQCSWPAESPFC